MLRNPVACVLGFFLTTVALIAPASSQVTETTLFKFDRSTSGGGVQGPLVIDPEGNLFGTTPNGGTHNYGTVFELTPSASGWIYTELYSFTDKDDGGYPNGGLARDSEGNLFGTTVIGGHGGLCSSGCGVVFELSPSAGGQWTEQTLYTFMGLNDGAVPEAGVVIDAAGNLYGTTTLYNNGAVFELSPSSGGWVQKNLHAFGGTDGDQPSSLLTLDDAGNIYGVAGGGNQCGFFNCGVVFRLSLTAKGIWKETRLHIFSGGHDGAVPVGQLVFDAAGNLYGTTTYGGKPQGCPVKGFGDGCGVVYKLSPNSGGTWSETVLHVFTGGSDGANPFGGVIFDASGNLVGTTGYGGIKPGIAGFGTIFGLTPTATGWRGRVLHTFLDGNDGGYSTSGLSLGADGLVYGVTISGGTKSRAVPRGAGVAFAVSE